MQNTEQERHRIAGHWVTLGRAQGPRYDMSGGELLTAIRGEEPVAIGSIVRLTHGEPNGIRLEFWRVLEIEDDRGIRPPGKLAPEREVRVPA